MEKLLPINLLQTNSDFSKPNLHFFQSEELDLHCFDIALLSFQPENAIPLRKRLYTQQFDLFNQLEILDLGDAYALSIEEIVDLVQTLISHDIFPILIGFPIEIIKSVSQFWEKEIHPHSISWVSSYFNKDLHSILENNIFIKNQYYLGLQRQLSIIDTPSSNLVPVYLSDYRKSNSSIEAYTRNSEMFFFQMDVVRSSDFEASSNPSGFFAEEIISIAKLAGSSDRSLMCIISDWDNDLDQNQNNKCNTLIAQMVWYMIEGYTLKLKDKTNKTKNLTHYIVEVKNSDIHLDFYKSEATGKWWIQEPGLDADYHGKLIPCSYEEYLKTVQENLPERLLELIYH